MTDYTTGSENSDPKDSCKAGPTTGHEQSDDSATSATRRTAIGSGGSSRTEGGDPYSRSVEIVTDGGGIQRFVSFLSSDPTPEVGIDLDTLLDEIGNSRRRRALRAITAHGALSLQALARELASQEQDCQPEDVAREGYRRVYISLYQTHVPRLDEAGLVAYRDDQVYPTPSTDPAVQVLDWLGEHTVDDDREGESQPEMMADGGEELPDWVTVVERSFATLYKCDGCANRASEDWSEIEHGGGCDFAGDGEGDQRTGATLRVTATDLSRFEQDILVEIAAADGPLRTDLLDSTLEELYDEPVETRQRAGACNSLLDYGLIRRRRDQNNLVSQWQLTPQGRELVRRDAQRRYIAAKSLGRFPVDGDNGGLLTGGQQGGDD